MLAIRLMVCRLAAIALPPLNDLPVPDLPVRDSQPARKGARKGRTTYRMTGTDRKMEDRNIVQQQSGDKRPLCDLPVRNLPVRDPTSAVFGTTSVQRAHFLERK